MKNKDELVWIDDGLGPILAASISGTSTNGQFSKQVWIREPKQVKRKDVGVGDTILTPVVLRLYQEAIARAKNKASKKK